MNQSPGIFAFPLKAGWIASAAHQTLLCLVTQVTVLIQFGFLILHGLLLL
jgi:hypothetical protein